MSRAWSKLFREGVTSDALTRAEDLLEELRPESPLRHRLGSELEELRSMAQAS
ncbi:MAG: hypothetical protein WEA31_05190 [Pirellulales bacterium]